MRMMLKRTITMPSKIVHGGVGASGDPFVVGTFKPVPAAIFVGAALGTAISLGAGKLVIGGVLAAVGVLSAVLAKPDFATGTES